ncbi:MAG: hypothetical protein BWY72_02390 [Bacteroidetes bacterium ADurb.Bin416]|nr:MAG: hypothetical protein BWY72_02390 [Bacteroidetes bacterium ADurb.Bin416]
MGCLDLVLLSHEHPFNTYLYPHGGQRHHQSYHWGKSFQSPPPPRGLWHFRRTQRLCGALGRHLPQHSLSRGPIPIAHHSIRFIRYGHPVGHSRGPRLARNARTQCHSHNATGILDRFYEYWDSCFGFLCITWGVPCQCRSPCVSHGLPSLGAVTHPTPGIGCRH